jgi:hypothetical protein
MAAQTIPTIHPADMKSIELAYRMGWPLVFDAEGIPTCALCDREVGDCDHTEITCDLCNKIISEDEAEDNGGLCWSCYVIDEEEFDA